MINLEGLELKRLEHSLKRLAASDTQRKRHFARREFARAMRDLEKTAKRLYPELRDNGEPVIPKICKSYQCPICRVPVGNVSQLAGHLVKRHQYHQCPCRKVSLQSVAGRRHLASVDDLAVHFAGYTLMNAGRVLVDTLDQHKGSAQFLAQKGAPRR
jgi:hypothetical protein